MGITHTYTRLHATTTTHNTHISHTWHTYHVTTTYVILLSLLSLSHAHCLREGEGVVCGGGGGVVWVGWGQRGVVRGCGGWAGGGGVCVGGGGGGGGGVWAEKGKAREGWQEEMGGERYEREGEVESPEPHEIDHCKGECNTTHRSCNVTPWDTTRNAFHPPPISNPCPHTTL